jgi:hypothetical protein
VLLRHGKQWRVWASVAEYASVASYELVWGGGQVIILGVSSDGGKQAHPWVYRDWMGSRQHRDAR